ncbi:MAG: hypothetical protein JNM18_19780 [Planctomycetaceae bacterium]|nr:hypothetical protein [Planctomycetaceae bacterium]
MATTMSVQVEDFTGSVRHEARDVPVDATIGEFIASVSRLLLLPDQDSDGRPVTYGAQTLTGDVLNGSEKIGDVVDENTVVQLTRNVTAG